MNHWLAPLIGTLRQAGLELSAEDMADSLWLALRTVDVPPSPTSEPGVRISAPSPESGPPSVAAKSPPSPPPPEQPKSEAPSLPEPKSRPPDTAETVPVHLPRPGPDPAGIKGRPFRSPAAPALPGALGLARALRPLMRRVPSRTRMVFDEVATVARVADEGLWLPALRPAPDRWLSVALVIDESSSMGLWRQAAKELRQLFEWMGAFRQVQVWGLDADRCPPLLRAGLGRQAANRTVRNPLELVDPGGRSLVVILSDCVSAAWHDGSARELIEVWGRRGPAVLLQLLPEHLWPRTALGAATPVRLQAPAAAVANARLTAQPVYDWPDAARPRWTPLPVATVEPAALAGWAGLVAGLGGAWMPGFILDSEPPEPFALAPEALTAEERLRRFQQAAAPFARRLSHLLAAAPVISLPVLRLLRQTLLPQARQVHEAELLLGGLLYVEDEGEEPADPDQICYQFHEGVRDLLLDGLPAGDALDVLEKVSGYIEDHLGQMRDFQAILADPAASPGALQPHKSPFASIAADVLLRLGGDYARLVSRSTPVRAEELRSIPAIEDASVAREQEESRIWDENIRFTVYRPRAVIPERWYPLLAFAHLAERAPDAEFNEPHPIEEVSRQARQILGSQAGGYQDVTKESELAVPRAGEFTLVPEIPGIQFNPPRASFLWLEPVHRQEFRLRAGAVLDGQTLRGRLTVFWGTIILAEVPLTIRVDSRQRTPVSPLPMDTELGQPYRRIFACYSHRDRPVVEQIEQLARLRGDDFLMDSKQLRAGEVWADRLREMIAQADIFLLFWSRNAMHSPFLRQEWEYALSLNRPSYIRPLYWEEPLPEDPSQDLPPKALRRLHFQRISPPSHLHHVPSPGVVAIDLGNTSTSLALVKETDPRPATESSSDTAPTRPSREKPRSDPSAAVRRLEDLDEFASDLVTHHAHESEETKRQMLAHLIESCLPLMTAYVQQMRVEANAAEDIVQEVILRLMLKGDFFTRFDPAKGTFSALVRTVLRRRVIDEFRSRRSRRIESDLQEYSEDTRERMFDVPDPAAEGLEGLEMTWARGVVEEALRRMEAKCAAHRQIELWQVFDQYILGPVLRQAPQDTYADLKRRFGFPSTTHVARVLRKARQLFAGLLQDELLKSGSTPDEVEADVRELLSILSRHTQMRLAAIMTEDRQPEEEPGSIPSVAGRLEFVGSNLRRLDMQLGQIVTMAFPLTVVSDAGIPEDALEIQQYEVDLLPNEGDWLRVIVPDRDRLPWRILPNQANPPSVELILNVDTTRLDRQRHDGEILRGRIDLIDQRRQRWSCEVQIAVHRPPQLRHPVAIDWGSITLRACYYASAGTEEETDAQILEVPALLYFKDLSDPQNPIFFLGEEAHRLGRQHPECCLRDLKRLVRRYNTVFVMDEQGRSHSYPAWEIVKMMLHRFVDFAETQLGREIHHLGLAMPSDRLPRLRQGLQTVLGNLARDLQRERRPMPVVVAEPEVDETTAVVIHLLASSRDLPLSPSFRVAIYDFGASRVSTAVLEVITDPKSHQLLRTRYHGLGGRSDFGSDDLTRAVLHLLHQRLSAALRNRDISLDGRRARLQTIPLLEDGEQMAGPPAEHLLARRNWEAIHAMAETLKVKLCSGPVPDRSFQEQLLSHQDSIHATFLLSPDQTITGSGLSQGTLPEVRTVCLRECLAVIQDERLFFQEIPFDLADACDYPLQSTGHSGRDRNNTVREKILDTVLELVWLCNNAEISPNAVVLAGEGQRLPLLTELLREHFPWSSHDRMSSFSQDPATAGQWVVRGLARHLQLRQHTSSTVELSRSDDVLPCSLGLMRDVWEGRLSAKFEPVLPAGTAINDPSAWFPLFFGAEQVKSGEDGETTTPQLILYLQDWHHGLLAFGFFDLAHPNASVPTNQPCVAEALPLEPETSYKGEIRFRRLEQIDLCVTLGDKRYGPYTLVPFAPGTGDKL